MFIFRKKNFIFQVLHHSLIVSTVSLAAISIKLNCLLNYQIICVGYNSWHILEETWTNKKSSSCKVLCLHSPGFCIWTPDISASKKLKSQIQLRVFSWKPRRCLCETLSKVFIKYAFMVLGGSLSNCISQECFFLSWALLIMLQLLRWADINE